MGDNVEKSGGRFVKAFDDAAPDVAEALSECLSRQSQELRRLELIRVGELQDGREENAIDFELGLSIQVRAPRLEASADEVSEGGPPFLRSRTRRGFAFGFRRAQ